MNHIYMDNAATTRVLKPVLEAMIPYLTEHFGNPSSSHACGRAAHKAIDRARAQVARAIGASAQEVYFTGSGTEANNWALFGAARALKDKGRHIVTSPIEHHAVLFALNALIKAGFEVTRLPVDESGLVSPDDFRAALRPDTILATVMTANNEVGTIQPIQALSAIARERGVCMHTDAVQAIGAVAVDVGAMGVDLLALSGHKFHAPKGVGALYVRDGVLPEPLLYGGAQERGRRAGTENVASIVGMGEAIVHATTGMDERNASIARLRDRLIGGILSSVPGARLNGHARLRLPGNVSVSVEGVRGDALVAALDMEGIAASAGAACTAGSIESSHVLEALGAGRIEDGALRLSLSGENTEAEVDRVISALGEIVRRKKER